MSIKAIDVISDDDVRAVLEERTDPMYQFRRAYKDHDATGIDSGSFEFPQAVDNLRGEMSEVGESSNYPESGLNYEGITADYQKDGFIVRVSDEAVDDSAFDVIMDSMEEMAQAAESRLDGLAYTGLANNQNSEVIGSDNTDLNYAATVGGYTQLIEDEFVPENFEMYVSTDGWGDLATDSQFTQATAQGEATVRNGTLDSSLGVPIYATNTGDLGDDEAFMVDTNYFGYESTRWDREVDSEYDFDNDETKYKVRHRKDFVVMKPSANIKIQGGV